MKRKVFFYFTFAIFFYFISGLFINRYTLDIIDTQLDPDHPPNYYDYSGIINVHTNRSTGIETYQSIVAAAEEAGLDFIYFTDHNMFDPPSEFEGYHGSVLTFVGGEYSYLNTRLLNLGARTKRHLLGIGRSQIVFADLLSQANRDLDVGGFFLAHPLKTGYQWSKAIPPGLSGIEVINLKEIWRTAWVKNPISFLWTIFLYPFNPELAYIRLFDPPKNVTSYWDRLNAQQKTIGLSGADAEAQIKTPFGRILDIPSYKVLFTIMRNHVILPSELTGDARTDMKKINQAILNGQFYFSLDIMANPKGFLATIEGPDGTDHLMGSQVEWKKGMQLKIHLPQKPKVPFDTIVYKNGEVMVLSNSQDSTFQIHGPGTYRVVVRVIPTFPLPDGKKWIEWIYTNPFYVTAP